MRIRLALGIVAGLAGLLAAAILLAWGGGRAEAGEALPYPLDEVDLELITSGLDDPVDIAFTGVPTDMRMFVVERRGRIKIVQGGTVALTSFLDISPTVDSSFPEEGLLGLAFAPNFGSSGQFYVYYVVSGGPDDGDLRLSRFSVSGNPDVADPTETVILTIPHPGCENHNGGDLNFGPDGYLYLAPGDGGGGNDNCLSVPEEDDNDAQRLSSLLGKVLRLNVTGQVTYTIPASNPFTQTANALPEIWAWGLRNPWRFSFDQLTGGMYIADVGQDDYEEVSFQPANSTGGENYGWRCREGLHPNVQCGTVGPYVDPIFEYDRSQGSAVTGGFVYRGSDHPALTGYYFLADYVSGRFWAWGGCAPSLTGLGQLVGGANPSSFGQDPDGEMYVADLGGSIYRLVGPEAVTPLPLENAIFLPLVANGNGASC